LKGFDIVKEAGGPDRAVVKEIKGVKVKNKLILKFVSSNPRDLGTPDKAPVGIAQQDWEADLKSAPLICGVQVVEEGRPLGYISYYKEATVQAGEPYVLSNIKYSYNVFRYNQGAQGKLHYRQKGEKKFTGVALTPTAWKGIFTGTIPGKYTGKHFEYYVEMWEQEGRKSITEPLDGAKGPALATPDYEPPSPPAKLHSGVHKKRRIAEVIWFAAKDDSGVSHYKIFRGDSEGFKCDSQSFVASEGVGNTKGTRYHWYDSKKLQPAQPVWYAVVTVDHVGRSSQPAYVKIELAGE
jgi:hypothetical protein